MNNNVEVLYVDDEDNNLFLFESLFSLNFNIITANSGLSGLNVLESHQNIKVVVSDIKMPNMDGMEFIRKAREKQPGLIFIVLTGFDISGEIKDAISSGLVKTYIQKPFKVEQIENALYAVIR